MRVKKASLDDRGRWAQLNSPAAPAVEIRILEMRNAAANLSLDRRRQDLSPERQEMGSA